MSAKTVADVNDVKSSLITTRRIVFAPAQELKDELHNTAIQITCYDRDGNIVKRVTSADDGTVEAQEDNGDDNGKNEGSLTPAPSPQGDGNENQGGSQTPTIPSLTITKTGAGSSTVKVGGNAVNSGSQIAANTQVTIEVTPATGQTPTATIDGQSVTLTNNEGTYTDTFNMPSADATLIINSGSTGGGADQN